MTNKIKWLRLSNKNKIHQLIYSLAKVLPDPIKTLSPYSIWIFVLRIGLYYEILKGLIQFSYSLGCHYSRVCKFPWPSVALTLCRIQLEWFLYFGSFEWAMLHIFYIIMIASLWLCALVMSHTSFTVNLHSAVAWTSSNTL